MSQTTMPSPEHLALFAKMLTLVQDHKAKDAFLAAGDVFCITAGLLSNSPEEARARIESMVPDMVIMIRKNWVEIARLTKEGKEG